MNKKIYKIGKKDEASHRATTEYDVTEKDITPIGGFPHYGVIDEDYVMIKARDGASLLRSAIVSQQRCTSIQYDLLNNQLVAACEDKSVACWVGEPDWVSCLAVSGS